VTLLSSVTVTDHPWQVCDAWTWPVFAPAGPARPTTAATRTPATSPTRPARPRAIPKTRFTTSPKAQVPVPDCDR